MRVTGRFNYIDPTAPDPTTYYVPPPPGVPICSVVDAPHEMTITDARDAVEDFTVDRNGFSFVSLPTDFQEFDDEHAVRTKLYPRMEAITRERLGVEVGGASSHAIRRRPKKDGGLRGAGLIRQPLHRVHCDFTPVTARELMLRTMGEAGRDMLDRRFAIVNYWRPIVGPLRDDPLAIIDPHSVAPEDLVRVRHVYEEGDGEIYGVAHNPRHRWYYKSDMEPGDAIFFKVYDSGEDNPLVGPHSAFTLENPVQPVPPRESFELRLIIFYD